MGNFRQTPFFLCWFLLSLIHLCHGQDVEKTQNVDQSQKALSREQTPNVIIIFMDDMGYADIGSFGATEYQTPHLDRLASQGRRFTDFVASSAVCSASRAALMTGCNHRRIGLSGALAPSSTIGLHANEVTLAEICKSVGYDTACFGKWHLGHHPKFLPTAHGFDEFYGIPYSNDMWPLHPDVVQKRKVDPNAPSNWPPLPLIEGEKVINPNILPSDQKLFTKNLTQRAVDFIQQERDHPFFLYLPHPMVHVPLFASDEFEGKSGVGLFGDVMMEVDWSVGQIIQAVESIDATEETLIIFTSDNGPWLSYGKHAGSTGALKEGKGTMWEGGYRVPTVMHWPGRIPAGTQCDSLCSTIDVLPTVAALIGADLPEHKIDGKNILGLMTGELDSSPHDSFPCYYSNGELHAIRNEKYKLVFPHRYRTLNGQTGRDDGFPIPYQHLQATRALYDLDDDVSEVNNILHSNPEVVALLSEAAEVVRNELGDTLTNRPALGTRKPGQLTETDTKLIW